MENGYIDKFPKIFKMYEGNPGGINWGTPVGWDKNIEWMCEVIQNYIDHYKWHDKDGKHAPEQIECLQIKEKFGGLRFYMNHYGDAKIDGMVMFAEYLCENTCTHCGSMEDVKMKAGWIEPVCAKCVEKHKYKLLEDNRKVVSVKEDLSVEKDSRGKVIIKNEDDGRNTE